jgi:hypothetical protein
MVQVEIMSNTTPSWFQLFYRVHAFSEKLGHVTMQKINLAVRFLAIKT